MIFYRSKILLISLFFATSALAEEPSISPSFDCNKKNSPIEEVICSDAKLSELDNTLAKKFSETKSVYAKDSKFLIDDQRRWLKTRIQQCSYNGQDELPADDKKQDYVNCLERLYEQRIQVLSYPEFWPPLKEENVDKAIARLRTMNPQDVYNITTSENRNTISELSCRFFEKDPVAASKTFAAYFGSSMDGWNPLCNKIDIADRVPEVKTLLTALNPIWGASTACEGTIRSAYGRSEMIIRILAAVDPNPMENEKEAAPHNWEALGYAPDLKHWSEQGNWEKRQYDGLQPVLKNAEIALAHYYETTFRVNEAQASSAAEFHITQIIRQLTEHSGGSSTLSYMSMCFDTNDLDAYLKSSVLPEKTCPYGEFTDMSKEATLRRFLGLGIVNHYPIEAIKKLIADGAELDQKNQEFKHNHTVNDTPLMLAAAHPEIIELLLKAGANVNAQNNFGKTALMYAIQERNLKSVSLLLNAHADVNLATHEDINCSALKAGSRTPLMYAVWEGTSEIIKMLVEAHADILAKDSNGETASLYLGLNDTLTQGERKELEGALGAGHL